MKPNLEQAMKAVPGVVYQVYVGLDEKWKSIYLSDGLRDLYECSPESAYADISLMMNCTVEEDQFALQKSVKQATKNLIPWELDFRIRTPSGVTKWIRGHAHPELQSDGSVLWNGLLVDISKTKATEKHLLRLQKMYAAVMEANRLIFRTQNVEELFQGICRIAVEFGGMKMAWIGIPEVIDQRMVPVARYGVGTDYLDRVFVSARADIPEGRGPTGTAFRENRTVLSQDFSNSPATSHWRELAPVYGWGSSAVFPIQKNGRSFATLSVYKAETNGFDDEVVTLLEELTADISHALTALSEIAERKKTEKALAESEERFNLFMDTLPAAAFIKDEDGTTLYLNRYMMDVLGAKNWQKKSTRELFPKEMAERMIADDRRAIDAGYMVIEEQVPNTDGLIRTYQTHKFRIPQKDRRPLLGGIAVDITEQRQMEEKIWNMAFFDPLTNLPNRRMLVDRLDQAYLRAKRYQNSLAVMFLDLDNFKSINDSLGHDFGDSLLKEIAIRLGNCVRTGDTVSRHGGDEFIILLPEISCPEDAALVADKIIAATKEPIKIGENTLHVTTSIGIAAYPVNGTDDVQELLKKADRAMYAAKNAGRNGYRFFE